MQTFHLGTGLLLSALLVACGDSDKPNKTVAGDAAAGLPHPAETLAALPPEAQPYGLDVYTEKCLACHGKLGEGAEGGPAITGIKQADMYYKLLPYRAGTAQGTPAKTKAMAALSEAEIAAASIYAGE
jgi:cytochrome c553